MHHRVLTVLSAVAIAQLARESGDPIGARPHIVIRRGDGPIEPSSLDPRS